MNSSLETAWSSISEGGAASGAKSESKRPGHGRIPAADYTGAKIVRIDHHHLKSGDPCPDPACLGRLHALSEPNIKLYLTGRPCVEATKYERSVLRCSGCDQRISAALPVGVAEDRKFDPTADVTIALLKYGAGMPFYRQARLQEACGVPLPESVQFERCEEVAKAALPVYRHLLKLTADGKFKEIEENFPMECLRVLEAIRKVYENDARTVGMSESARLEYHQAQSGPVMEALRDWIEKQFEEKKVEPNSGLGKAYQYLRNHWPKLTGFLSVPGAPLDNNEVERALKRFVLFRKNSLFYKTEHGAEIGSILMSLIESCRLNKGNVFEYLLALLRDKAEARRNPEHYLPWNYQGAAARAA